MKKTMKISEELHQLIKVYCVKNKLKMNEWVEKELIKIIENNDINKGD
jgi:predicted HicB family RNase H-like nuclease